MKKLLSFFAVAAAAAVAITSCKNPEPTPVPTPEVALESITVSPATLTLEVGQTDTLTVAYEPEDAADKPEVEWSTSDPEVATVDGGIVTAVAPGTATITATADKFTATATVTVTDGETPGPAPEPEDKWDYTPSADYTAEANLWKPVADANAEVYFYYHSTGDQWNGTPTSATEVSFLSKKESTYRIYYADATYGEVWLNQLFIYSDEDHLITLDPAKKYQFKVTLGASESTPAFFKLAAYKPASKYADSDTDENKAKHEGATIWEKGKFTIEPATPVVLETEFSGIEAEGINLIMAYGGNPENDFIYVKDITLVETGDAHVEEPEDKWDYTPSAEYLASADNLWKPVFDGNHDYIYGQITGYQKVDITDFPAVVKNQSTYKLTFAEPTSGEWGNCNFLAPATDHPISLTAGKKYKLKVTVGATAAISKFIFSLHVDNPAADNREGDWLTDMWGELPANTPTEFTAEITPGSDIANISWTIIPQFGTPAGMVLYIKDIIVEQVVEEDVPVESDWELGLLGFYGPGWAPDITADAEVKLLADNGLSVKVPANVGGEDWQGQVLIVSKTLKPQPDKYYQLSYKVSSDKTGEFISKLSAWAGDVDAEGVAFVDERQAVEAGVTTSVVKEFSGACTPTGNHAGMDPTQMPFVYVLDFAHMGGATIVFSNITIEEIDVAVPVKFQWREDSVAEQTVSYEAGAAHWYIDADKDVDFDVVVKLNGKETTESVTVESYPNGGGHIAVNYPANTTASEKVWDITVTTDSYVENRTLTAKLTQNPYEYTDLSKFNADIIASGTSKVDRVLNISEDAKLYVTKKNGKYVYAQSRHDWFTGGVLFYGTGLEGSVAECNTVYGRIVVTTTTYNGVPEVTAIVDESGATIGYDSSVWPCEKPTIGALLEDYMKYVSVKIELNNNYNGVTVSDGFSTSDRNGQITDSTGSIALYVQNTDGTITGHITGTKLNKIIVWPTFFNANKQVALWSQPTDVKSIPSTITMPATKALGVGDTFNLEATTVQPDATITYASSNEAVATVSAEGLVTAVAEGEATITASVAAKDKYLDAEATCVVTVTTEGSTDVEFALYTGEIVEGDYIIYYSGKAMNTTVANNRLQYEEVTPDGNSILNPDDAIIWHIAASGDSWTLYNAAAAQYAVSTGTRNQAVVAAEAGDKGLWTITETAEGAMTYEIVNDYNKGKSINCNLRNNSTYGFAAYGTSTGGPLSLYKKK